jgi:hypothetical protein
MFTSFFAWLKSVFSFEPTVIGKVGCSDCGSCKCHESVPVVEEVAPVVEEVAPVVEEVAPVKKVRKTRTPKA